MKKFVIFDLDGTLLNTIADLAISTNHALRENGFGEHEIEEYKFFVGNGINKLFERALPEGEKSEENILKIRKSFLKFYDEHNCDFTKPYEGIPELLESLAKRNISIAVASNKYHSATEKLIMHYFPNIKFDAVMGNIEGVPAKPDPQIVFNILKGKNLKNEEILYVGDSGVDMQTAINSNIDACGVVWGFRPEEELTAFKSKYIVRHPEEILKIAEMQ